MLPTLAAYGDGVMISKFYRRGRGIEVGDIVSVKHPLFLGQGVIKRVLGMPGDFVLKDTPGKGEGIMVPEGHCWLAGDNIPHSRDSRMYGPVPLALIKGKVIARVYPWKDRKWLTNSLQPP
ncbi:MAG: hypothetical protein M1836_003851 [Candelina mexicana]|nr:MAG: hypothetical protein M1836_003851 [Candelina mexicana]